MDAVGPDGEGDIEAVVDDQRHPKGRHERLDPLRLLDKGPRRGALFPELNAGGPSPDRLEDDIREGLLAAEAAVGDKIQPFITALPLRSSRYRSIFEPYPRR